MRRYRRLTSLSLLLVTLTLVTAQADAPAPAEVWNRSEHVVVAKLDHATAGPMGMSHPPMRTYRLGLTVKTVLRGTLKEGKAIKCGYIVRQVAKPVLPVGKDCIVAASFSRGRLTVQRVEAADDKALAVVTAACSLPIGWSLQNGKPVCPWVVLGDKAWPKVDAPDDQVVRCSKTGRPVLLAGGVTFTVKPAPPAKAIKWTNPDGDGSFIITVTNPGDTPVKVPALLSLNGKILWSESLLILCQNSVYACPGAVGVSAQPQPTTLAAGQTVTTTVNALGLDGPRWPRGGRRIEFRFCLGEMSRTRSFYYLSRHHDKLRDAARKEGS